MGLMKDGDEIIVPSNTYIASILAISKAGLTPVLVEPDERDKSQQEMVDEIVKRAKDSMFGLGAPEPSRNTPYNLAIYNHRADLNALAMSK